MQRTIYKPLFWTNVIGLIFAGWLIAGLAFGWTNPGSSPPGGGGAIGAGANAPVNSLYIDSGGRIGVGKTNPYANSKIDVNGSIALVGQRVFDLSGGALTIGDIDSGDGTISNINFRTSDATRLTIDGSGNATLAAGTLTSPRLRLTTGAAAGRVLISDVSGIASWQTPTWVGAGGNSFDCGRGNYLQGISSASQPICATLPAAGPAPGPSYPITDQKNAGSSGEISRRLVRYPGITYLFSSDRTERVSVYSTFGYSTGLYVSSGSPDFYAYVYDGNTRLYSFTGGPSPGGSGYTWTTPTFNLAAGSHDLHIRVWGLFSITQNMSSASMRTTRQWP